MIIRSVRPNTTLLELDPSRVSYLLFRNKAKTKQLLEKYPGKNFAEPAVAVHVAPREPSPGEDFVLLGSGNHSPSEVSSRSPDSSPPDSELDPEFAEEDFPLDECDVGLFSRLWHSLTERNGMKEILGIIIGHYMREVCPLD